jgi:hypothetical protein
MSSFFGCFMQDKSMLIRMRIHRCYCLLGVSPADALDRQIEPFGVQVAKLIAESLMRAAVEAGKIWVLVPCCIQR